MADDSNGFHELAILFDDVCGDVDGTKRELRKLIGSLPGSVKRRLDLIFLPPTALVCRLRMSGGSSVETGRLTLAQQNKFRVLNMMALAPSEREQFYSSRMRRSTWRAESVDDPSSALESLREHLALPETKGLERRDGPRVELALSARVTVLGQTLVGLARNISPTGLFIESELVPKIGTGIAVSFETTVGHAPARLPAEVLYNLDEAQATKHRRGPGFGARFTLSPERQDLLESFLLAAARGRAWPEQSGRRHGRFGAGARVEFEWNGNKHTVPVANVSRGGAFLIATAAPPVGTTLPLTFLLPGGARPVQLDAEVVRAVEQTGGQGIGVQFQEPPNVVEATLRKLLDSVTATPNYSAIVIDGDSFYRGVLSSVLRPAGFECIEASDANQAFMVLLESVAQTDAVLVDRFVTGMGLAEFIGKLQALTGERRPAVVVFADDPERVQSSVLSKSGIDAVLGRDDAATVLLPCLANLLEAKKALQPPKS